MRLCGPELTARCSRGQPQPIKALYEIGRRFAEQYRPGPIRQRKLLANK